MHKTELAGQTGRFPSIYTDDFPSDVFGVRTEQKGGEVRQFLEMPQASQRNTPSNERGHINPGKETVVDAQLPHGTFGGKRPRRNTHEAQSVSPPFGGE